MIRLKNPVNPDPGGRIWIRTANFHIVFYLLVRSIFILCGVQRSDSVITCVCELMMDWLLTGTRLC
jgi:hypothetical protein